MDFPFNPNAFIANLAPTAEELDLVAAYGRDVASQIERVDLVSSGGCFHSMETIQCLTDQVSTEIVFRTFRSVDYIRTNPRWLDRKRTLVVFASVSGATKETFHAAKLARGRADTTVAFTKFDTSPLAGCCNKAFLVGTAQREFLAIFMLMHAFVGGLLEKREEWELLPKLLSSLKAFGPAVASDATKPLQGEDEDADFLEKNDHIYFVGCGAGDLLGGSFGRCILTEMLECQVHPITAGDFFFSTLEIIGKETPVVLILNEDRGLEYMQRIERFCRRYSVRTRVVDARDFTMSGIDTEIRPIVGPYLLGEYLVRIVVPSLVVKRGKPLSERNYIGKVDY